MLVTRCLIFHSFTDVFSFADKFSTLGTQWVPSKGPNTSSKYIDVQG